MQYGRRLRLHDRFPLPRIALAVGVCARDRRVAPPGPSGRQIEARDLWQERRWVVRIGRSVHGQVMVEVIKLKAGAQDNPG